MKLHLPLFLRKAILALMLAYGVPAVQAADLTLGAEDSLSVDYSVSGSLQDLNNGTLQLSGGTTLQLSSCGEGDGKTYTLLTGVSSLLGADGSAITLDDTNNAASRYFDTTQPGSGFWADGTLQLNNGALQIVLHNETVKEAISITTRQVNPSAYQYYAGVSFENIEYDFGSSYAKGGAIYGAGDITLSNNGSVTFSGNTASVSSYSSSTSSYGGAIYGSTITLSDNGSVSFSGNTASTSSSYSSYSYSDSAYGGAIYGDTITLSDNGSVTFSGNTASASTYAYGGAIYDHTITLSDNESVSFIGNTAESASSSASGGAIYGDVTMTGNGDVSFSGNTASSSSSSSSDSDSSAYGGAIYGNYYGSTITLSDNGSVTFSGNTASASSSYYYASDSAYGGAIYGDDSTITLSDNESVSFIGNTAESASSSAYGGAIYGHSYSIITLSNNGSVVFEGNTAESASSSYYYASDSAYGGAIYGDFYSTITLSNNGSVSLSGNTATGNYAYGGAIYACGDLSIRNNASVAFYQNAEVVNGNTYRLRSIYAGGSGAEISLSAAAGKSITFRDSIYIGESSSFKLNEAYEGKAQLGDIIFTGATTESDLYTVKGNVAGTMEEIRLSRTTEVNTMTNLYGGRLRVEDGAVYRGRGITAMADSKSTVRGKNATLSQKGYTLTFNSGTTLELAGANTITGNVQMENGSILSFDCSESEGMTVIDGTMNLGGTLSLTLNGEVDAENVVLLYASDGIGGWNEGYINTAGNSYALLDNELLVLNYNKNAGLPAFKGDTVITSRQSTAGTYKYYNSVTFQNIAGGAMYGGAMDGSLEMSHNGGIRFIGNSARFGGALSGSTVALNHNGSVLFENNNATGASYAYGGAIYGKNNSSISLIGNDSVAFKNNTSTTYGGAIFVTQGTAIKLHENGSVIFTGNSTDDCGGAIFSQVTVSLKDNESVTFSGNYAGYGGAMDVRGNIELCGNGNVVFSGNCALDASYSYGGAIYTSGNLHLCNNDSVLFERNLEKTGGEYNLRSIHVGGNTVSFSAAEGKTIEFRDSMFVDSGTTFNLNETYYGEAQTGDILFTGEYTEKHLNEMMAAEGVGRKASSAEILDSRTTEVRALTNLHGGRLRVEDGAVYKGYGITTMADSSATVRVKSGTLNHQRYAVTFNRGTALEVAGQSSISANVLNLQQGSTLTFKLSNENSSKAVLTLSGSLNIQGAITLNLGLEGTELNAGMYKLLDLGSASVPSNWKKQNLTVESEYFEYEELTWVGSVLYLNNGRYISTDAPVIPDTPVTPEEPEIPDTPVIPDEPGSDEPGSELPGGDEPGSDEPGGELPGGDEPGSDEPGGELPGGDEPGSDEPGGELPGGDEPGNDEPGGELPGGDEPGSDEPGSDEPGGELPGGDEPGNDGPGGELPGGDEPGSNEPGGELPGGDEPGNDESGGELPGGDEPGIPDTPVTPDKPEGNKTVRPSGNTISTSEVTSNSKLVLEGKGTLTLNGKVSPASISVNISKNLTLKGAKTGGALAGDGDLTKKGNGTLTLNDGNGSWTGDTHLLAGTIKVKGTTSLGKGDVYVKGGTLNLGSKAIGNDIVQEKSATIKSGKKFTGTYTLESGELLKGSTLNISKTATLEGGSVNGTLTGTGTTTVTGNVKLGDKGKITTKALTLGEDATLTTSAKGLSSKTTTLSIGEDATLSLGGKMTVDSLKMNGGTLKTTASKPVAMTVKNNMELTDAVLSTNGKVTTNKLTLNNSTMGIKGAKAQNLTVKQALTIGSGSALTLNGKLSAGSLTIKSGGSLTMIGSKPVTLKVKGTLTLNEGSSIIMNYSFVQGKTYKVLTFGSYSGSKDYYSIFGVEADDCTITNTGKALTLTVTGKWKPQSQQKAVSADAATPIVAAKPQTNPVADALVQANWGQLEASRAFVNAMANRSMAVQLGNGERAVWASAIGSSSRHSSAGGHAGADTNVSGGVFGLETQVGRASLFGMALGNSWTRVSAHGFGTIEQDTTHLGLYGQSNWSSGISADWSAAYGRSESEAMGSDWNQKHLQLDGRVSYNHELNARTVLSPFAGVQYYASDAAGIGTTDTGSLQNLRAEIGVAASHRTGKLGVYGEIALHQDLARNNPSVSMEGVRYTGMNPGRTGLNFTIGASYELNDKWSVNASYTGEFVENANAHSANVGASYKF